MTVTTDAAEAEMALFGLLFFYSYAEAAAVMIAAAVSEISLVVAVAATQDAVMTVVVDANGLLSY